MKYYIIAGEASGDLHASKMIRELKHLDPEGEFRAWGGDKMASEGAEIVKHYRDLAFMGFVEVVANLRTILRNISLCKNDIKSYAPDVVILVDYPGFNLRIAKFLHQEKIRCFYYISPQIWAWKEGRVKQIKQYVDKMFVILPFEKEFYKKHDLEAVFVGNPLLDEVLETVALPDFSAINPDNKPIISILPGSRKQEIASMLPVMLKMKNDYPEYLFVIGGVSSIPRSFYQTIIGEKSGVDIVFGQTQALLKASTVSLITSGTASLEAALLSIPNVICYKGSAISVYIAKKVAKVHFIGLANLIMERAIVKELIQKDFNEKTLRRELDKLLHNQEYIAAMQSNFTTLKQKLGGGGASKKVAKLMYNSLTERD